MFQHLLGLKLVRTLEHRATAGRRCSTHRGTSVQVTFRIPAISTRIATRASTIALIALPRAAIA